MINYSICKTLYLQIMQFDTTLIVIFMSDVLFRILLKICLKCAVLRNHLQKLGI